MQRNRTSLQDLQDEVKAWAKEKGWMDREIPIPEQCALIHSEISEALEEFRDGHSPNEIYYVGQKPEGYPVELADAVIRILHYFSLLDLDLEEVIDLKMVYNQNRPYRHGGKIV